MKYDPKIHHRRSIRLQQYDYSQEGYYFVTICTKNHQCYFGKIVDGGIILNDAGTIVQQCWNDLPNHYGNCILDVFLIMPDHVHGIVIIDNAIGVGAGLKPAPTNGYLKRHGLFEIIRGFKTFSARKINVSQNLFHFQWQRNYYEHIIRNEKALYKIRQYIRNNPLKHLYEN